MANEDLNEQICGAPDFQETEAPESTPGMQIGADDLPEESDLPEEDDDLFEEEEDDFAWYQAEVYRYEQAVLDYDLYEGDDGKSDDYLDDYYLNEYYLNCDATVSSVSAPAEEVAAVMPEKCPRNDFDDLDVSAGYAKSKQNPVPIRTHRILAEGVEVSNDTWKTGLNNNDLIIGPTGSGKTRHYIKPNLMQGALPVTGTNPESFIVTDTKGNLRNEVGIVLKRSGFLVHTIDFTDLPKNHLGYNPLAFVRIDPLTGEAREQDVMRIATTLCPPTLSNDPYWSNAARSLIAAMIAYTLEWLPKEQQHLGTVYDLITAADSNQMEENFVEIANARPNCLFVKQFSSVRAVRDAEKTFACIVGVATDQLSSLVFSDAIAFYTTSPQVDFRKLGTDFAGLFLTVSDTDRSMDKLVNLLYSQAISELCIFADTECAGSRLPHPVRLYLDDFAASAVIPDFDNITSVIRSRGIAVSIVLQSITQLNSMYGQDRARTIINNCAHILYLGGHDLDTVNYIAALASCLPDRILKLPVNSVFLYTEGTGGQQVRRYPLEQHPCYEQLPEAKRAAEIAERERQEGEMLPRLEEAIRQARAEQAA